MKATEQYFPVLLFIILYKVVLTLVCVTIWRLLSSFQITNKITSASWALVCCCWCWTFIFLSKSSFSERSLFQESLERYILKGISSVDFSPKFYTFFNISFSKRTYFSAENWPLQVASSFLRLLTALVLKKENETSSLFSGAIKIVSWWFVFNEEQCSLEHHKASNIIRGRNISYSPFDYFYQNSYLFYV